MKKEIHPEYHTDCKVFFRGDHVMTIGATVPEMHVDIWSGSHPFYTGKASFVDAAGRVEKFHHCSVSQSSWCRDIGLID